MLQVVGGYEKEGVARLSWEGVGLQVRSYHKGLRPQIISLPEHDF